MTSSTAELIGTFALLVGSVCGALYFLSTFSRSLAQPLPPRFPRRRTRHELGAQR